MVTNPSRTDEPSRRSDDPVVTGLVIRARQAWDALVERYVPLIWSICRRYRLAHADADDIAQSIWLKLVDQLDRIRDPAALPGWLATTTRRECGRTLRAASGPHGAGYLPDAATVPDHHGQAADQELLEAERHAALREAFACLPSCCQQLLALLAKDPPVPYAEISARLSIPVGSIGPTRRRCLDKLHHRPAIAPLIDADAQTRPERRGQPGDNQVRRVLGAVRLPVMLSYDAVGTGPAVVLLHSTVCDRRMWDSQWLVLAAAGYQVVRCDFRGFGDTPVPLGPHNDAEDVLDLADELSLGPVAVVGASHGGKVALEIAARWPRQVTALALLCAGMPGHEASDTLRAFGQQEGELIEAGDIADAVELNVATWLGPEADEGTRDRVRQMQRHAFEVQLAAAEEYEPAKVTVDLRAITAPSMMVSGAKDLPDFRLIAARLAGLLPGARLVELPWAGHLPTLERPHELSQLLTVFLREAVPPG